MDDNARVPVPVYVLEGAAVRPVRQVGLVEFGEELQRRKLFQVLGVLCDQPLEATEDVIRQGAEGCAGDVPAQTNNNNKQQTLVFNIGVTIILISESMPFSTDVSSVCYM